MRFKDLGLLSAMIMSDKFSALFIGCLQKKITIDCSPKSTESVNNILHIARTNQKHFNNNRKLLIIKELAINDDKNCKVCYWVLDA